jgi:hypothetical protein
MMIIGCDFHPSWQQIAWLDSETGETGEEKRGSRNWCMAGAMLGSFISGWQRRC